MTFTDQQPRVATEDECAAKWGGRKGRFRCYLCGHKFKPGDIWRWVYASNKGVLNFMVCEECDGPDVINRWIAVQCEAKLMKQKFWWQ